MSQRLRLLLTFGVILLLGLPAVVRAAPTTRIYVGFPYGSQPQATGAALADALSTALGRRFTLDVVAGDAQNLALRTVREESGDERRLLLAGHTMGLNLSGMKPVAMVGDLFRPALTFALYGNQTLSESEVLELRGAVDDIVKSRRLSFINYASRPDPLPGTRTKPVFEAPVRTAVSGDFDGPQRFPVLPMKLVPREAAVPLKTQVLNQPSYLFELSASGPGEGLWQLVCDYGPFPDGTPEWSVLFWQKRRPNIAPEIIDKLQRRNPMTAPTMIDVVTDKCPRTWGLALAIGNREATVADIDREYSKASDRTVASGLRFANQLMFSSLGSDTSNTLYKGQTPPLAQLKKYDPSVQGYTARLGGFDGFSRTPSAEVAAELDHLSKQGYSLLSCAYGVVRDRDDELIIRDGSNFWFKKRPPVVSKALASWIEETKFPLVDVALNKCPKFLAQAVAVASGSGPEADKARRAADEAVKASMTYCDKLQAGDPKSEGSSVTALREPTAGDICQALETSLKASYAQWDGLADEIRRTVPGEAGRIHGGIMGLRTAFMGTAHPVVDVLEKRSCRKELNKATYICGFSASFTVHFKGGSLERVSNVPRQLQIPMDDSSRKMTFGEDGWIFVPHGSGGRDTAYDSYVENNLKNLQLDYKPETANPRRRQ